MASKPYFDKRRGVWRMKVKRDGVWKAVVLGKHGMPWSPSRPPRKPPNYIEDRARELQDQEFRERNNLPRKSRGVSLREYVERYIDSYARHGRAAGSQRKLRSHARRFLDFCAGRGVVEFAGVDRAVCRAYLDHRLATVGAVTASTERGLLSGIWTQAVLDGLVESNPWYRLGPSGAEPKKVPAFWTAEEIARIVAACRKEWHRDLVILMANTGLRISTALAIRRSWYDRRAGMIRIPPDAEGAIKTRYDVALNADAAAVLDRRLGGGGDPDDLAFDRGDGGPLSACGARGAIRRAIRRAGVRPGTPHDFRHSYGRHLVLSGVPLNVVQRQLGHRSISTTQIYTTSDEEAARRFASVFRLASRPGPDPASSPGSSD